jgi:hypothetical protein
MNVTGIQRENLIGTDFSIYFTEPERARQAYIQVFEKSFVSDYALTIKHLNGKLTMYYTMRLSIKTIKEK